MKTILHTITRYMAMLAVAFGTVSCLDKYPETSIPEKEAMKTFADAEQHLLGIYANLMSSSLYSGLLTLLPDIQSDLVQAVKGNSNTYGNFWLWNIRPTDLELEAVYAQLYTVIGCCNFYLDRIDEVVAKETSDTNLEILEQYTGEVYAIRALCYSELIKCFCKAYDPATAAQEQGVVLRTKYFEAEPVRRASLYDSYQFVVDDLIRAEERLEDAEETPNNYYMSQAAVQAIRARVALYMQDWGTAIAYSSKLIDDKQDTFQLASFQDTAPDGAPTFEYMWAYDMGPEVIWRIGFTSTSYGGALGTVFLNFNRDYTYFYPDYIPSQWVLDAYDDNDMRSTYFADSESGITIGYPSGMDYPPARQILRQPRHLHPDERLPRVDAQAAASGRAIPDPRRGLLPPAQPERRTGTEGPRDPAQDALRLGRLDQPYGQLGHRREDLLRRARPRALHGGLPPAGPQALGPGIRTHGPVLHPGGGQRPEGRGR